MRGIYFGQYHTAEDWGLILNAKSLTPPEPKTTYITIEGRDGDLDLSEALTGEIKYNNRLASFSFLVTDGTYSEREELIDQIVGIVHGRKLQIVTDDKPDHYLSGRCKITKRSNTKAYGIIEIECNCDPWFYKATETYRSFTISSDTDVILVNNGIKTVTPDIDVTGTVTLAYGSKSVSLSTGSYKLTDLQLKTGNTIISLGGSGSISFTYREGVL